MISLLKLPWLILNVQKGNNSLVFYCFYVVFSFGGKQLRLWNICPGFWPIGYLLLARKSGRCDTFLNWSWKSKHFRQRQPHCLLNLPNYRCVPSEFSRYFLSNCLLYFTVMNKMFPFIIPLFFFSPFFCRACLQMDNSELKSENNEYKLRIQALEQQSQLKDGMDLHTFSST